MEPSAFGCTNNAKCGSCAMTATSFFKAVHLILAIPKRFCLVKVPIQRASDSVDGVTSCCFLEVEKGSQFSGVEVRLEEDHEDDEAVQAVDGCLGTATTRDGDLGVQNSPDVEKLRVGEVRESDALAADFVEDGAIWSCRIGSGWYL